MNFVGISFNQASSWSIFSVKKDAVAFVRGPTRLRNLINPTIVFNASASRVFRSSNVGQSSVERDWRRMFQQWTLWTSLWTLGGFMPWKLAFLAVRKRCWGQHSRRVLVAVDSQTRDALRFYPEKERPRRNWCHVIFVDPCGREFQFFHQLVQAHNVLIAFSLSC